MSSGRALICVRGFGIDRLLDRAAALLPAHLSWTIVHVVDQRPEEELERALAALPGRHLIHARDGDDRIHRSVDQLQRDVQSDVEAWLTERGREADLAFRYGIPEQEIIALIEQLSADLVAIGARPEAGPHRFSHVSRFIVDHAPCSVLVLSPS
jgi:nucleotide-binding universal stress UspA family protein